MNNMHCLNREYIAYGNRFAYKILFCCLIIFFISPVMLFAQLAIKLDLNCKNYLQYEIAYAKVVLRNLSGHPLIFGNNPQLKGRLKFDIEIPSGRKASLLLENYLPLDGRVIPPGKTETLIIPLSKMYSISVNGEYKVKAVVEHSQLPNSYQSNSLNFKITPGIKIWDSIVGVPTVDKLDEDKKIQKRKYEIRSFFDGVDSVYCLLVEDRKYIYGVARIGYDIGYSKPECKIDRFSKLHILVQSSPSIYTYYVYDTDCHLDLKEVHKRNKTVPCLVRDPDSGRIFVAGGTKAREGTDYFEEKNVGYK
jgi:hypothetical protein